jgi:hypothetical protein
VNTPSNFSKIKKRILYSALLVICIWSVFWCGAFFAYQENFKCEIAEYKGEIKTFEKLLSEKAELSHYLDLKKNTLETLEKSEQKSSFVWYFASPIVAPVILHNLNRACSSQ